MKPALLLVAVGALVSCRERPPPIPRIDTGGHRAVMRAAPAAEPNAGPEKGDGTAPPAPRPPER